MLLHDDECIDSPTATNTKAIQASRTEIVSEQEVSLHAFTNNSNFWIFHIAASYKEHSLEVLIDTCSHNNFIQEGLVEKLVLFSVLAPKFRVYMGSGQFLLCDSICMNIPLLLQGHEFIVDLYVLPICGLDIMLGMQWLRALGPCLHDHEALTMEFNWKGRRVCLSVNVVMKPGQNYL